MDPNQIKPNDRVRLEGDDRLYLVRATANYCPQPKECDCHVEVRLETDQPKPHGPRLYRWVPKARVTKA